jgi:thiamine kinase-like enzyme
MNIKKLIKEIIKDIPQFHSVDFSEAKINVEKLNGWSNDNYLFSLNNKKLILRLPVVSEEEGINRQAEFYNTNEAAAAGLSYSFIYFNEKTGVSVREFIEGDIPASDEGPILAHTISDIAKTIQTLHTLSTPFLNKVNHFALIQNTIEHIQQRSDQPIALYNELLIAAHQVQNCLVNYPVNYVPCHNDLNPRNFLMTDNKIILIDWEYSGQGDPAWDLSYFITHGDLDEKSERQFLNHYFSGEILEEQYHRIILYKPLTLLIFSTWIRLQIIKKHTPVSVEELLYWEDALNQEINTYFLSEQHRQILKILNN